MRRPHRHDAPQPWCNRNELTDLLAAAEDEGGHPYALVCLLGLNGLRVFEARGADIELVGLEHGHRTSNRPPLERQR